MAQSTPLHDLLEQAADVFDTARELGGGFRDVASVSRTTVDPKHWAGFKSKFEELSQMLINLAPAISRPPERFEKIAHYLRKTGKLAKAIRDEVLSNGTFISYLEVGFDLVDFAHKGSEEVLAIRGPVARDPFAFVDELPATEVGRSTTVDSLEETGDVPTICPNTDGPKVKSDSQSAAGKTRKRPGRKKADEATEKREGDLIDAWNYAKESGIAKADFARGKGMTLKELETMRSRVAKRRKRAEEKALGQQTGLS